MLDLVLMTMEEKMKKVKIEKKNTSVAFSSLFCHLRPSKAAKSSQIDFILLYTSLEISCNNFLFQKTKIRCL